MLSVKDQRGYQVILEVLAHSREVVEWSDAHLVQVVPVPHTGQHQDLGGTDRAGRQDNLLAGQVGLYMTKPRDLQQHQVIRRDQRHGQCWLGSGKR